MSARLKVLWLQSGGCGGCTMSLLCAESPDLLTTLELSGIELIWHPALSAASGAAVVDLMEQISSGTLPLDVLCIEGSMLRGPGGSGRFHMFASTGLPMIEWVRRLAARSRYTVAIGTCAAFGGMTSSGSNPAEACGLQYDGTHCGGLLGDDYRAASGLPVINVAGCPTHPAWALETLMALAQGAISESDLDRFQRPRFYTDELVHHGCPRNEYYEYKASAKLPSQLGCMMEHLGCLGTQAHADCNTRLWNGEGSCIRGGFACINCTAPEFEEPGHAFTETPTIAGIPIGLPTDMPRAWFVALSSLSKAATPERLKVNAVSDHVRIGPRIFPAKPSK